ncbi:MAG TPA: helix-turn-helix transcriptional regulator [Alphaproteobacteria bacterium]
MARPAGAFPVVLSPSDLNIIGMDESAPSPPGSTPPDSASTGSAPIDRHMQDRVHALWDTLADFEAAHVEEARNHLLSGVCGLIGAQNAVWIGAVRLGDPQPEDPVKGWRPRAVRRLHPTPLIERKAKEQADMLDAGVVDVTVFRNVELSGQYRVNRLVELAPENWFEGDYYRTFYLGAGYRDAIWVGIPINEDAETYFGFYRNLGQEPFGTAERDIVAYALRSLRWFYRLQMLGEGLGVASAPLTPTERRILQGLLQGVTEKQIAAAVGQSPHTAHGHVKRIFRKYGVSSRNALMALWLGRPPP